MSETKKKRNVGWAPAGPALATFSGHFPVAGGWSC